jgi:hypothetical protein
MYQVYGSVCRLMAEMTSHVILIGKTDSAAYEQQFCEAEIRIELNSRNGPGIDDCPLCLSRGQACLFYRYDSVTIHAHRKEAS